jgi:hypothetical protein
VVPAARTAAGLRGVSIMHVAALVAPGRLVLRGQIALAGFAPAARIPGRVSPGGGALIPAIIRLAAVPGRSGIAGGDPRPAVRSLPGTAEEAYHDRTAGGYDGAKKAGGRKRHLLAGTLGIVLKVHVTAGRAC